MYDDLQYVQSREKEVDKLEFEKAEFSNEYDLLLQEFLSKDIMCSILCSFDDIDEQTEMQCLYLEKQCNNQDAPEFLEFFQINELKAQLQDKNTIISKLKKLIKKMKEKYVDTKFEKPSVVRQPNAFIFQKPSVLGVIHRTSVSIPQLRSTQLMIKQKEVEDHHRISGFSNKTKSVTACNDSLKSRTSNIKVVYVTCGKCVFNSNHDACVSKFINDMNARTKKPKVVPISTRKPKRKANQSIATSHNKTVAIESTIQKSMSYFRRLYENTSKT
ncbi:hypothetical protein Tco_1292752 [Tanacetum coccineum]